jgi:hypothetical protein
MATRLALAEFIKQLYRLPLGRSAHACRRMAERAEALGNARVAEIATSGLALARGGLELARRRRLGSSNSRYGPEAQRLDNLVDQLLTAIYQYLSSQATLLKGTPAGDSAAALIEALLPEGVGAITQLAFAEEYEAVTALLARLDTDGALADHARQVPQLGDILARLQASNAAYGESLKREEVPAAADVRTAEAAVQERLLVTVGAVISAYYDSEADLDTRDHLLEPLLEQNRAHATYLRRRRAGSAAVVDIDPDTGDEIVSPAPVGSPDLADAGDSTSAS